MRQVRGAIIGAGFVFFLAGSAAAQEKGLEFNAFAGAYAPTRTEGLQGTLEAVRRGSLAYGGRVTFWGASALGFEATGVFSPARIRVTARSGNQFARSTGFLGGAAKLMFNLTPRSTGLGIALGAGPAAIHTFETVANPDASTTDVGGVGGLALRLNVGENVALRGDVEDWFYNGNFGRGGKLTHDFVLSAGLSIRF